MCSSDLQKTAYPIYKINNAPEGSVYVAFLAVASSDFEKFFDGTKQFLIEVKKFIYKNTIPITLNISGGTQTSTPAPNVNNDQETLGSLKSNNCCFQFYTDSKPVYTSNWPDPTYDGADRPGYLCDFSVPETTTYQSVTFSEIGRAHV